MSLISTNLKFLKKNIWLILILLVNLGVVLYPTLTTSLPITQTDGLTYYGISETLATTGDFTAELPDYLPVKGEEGMYVNEFLPVPTLYLAGMIKLFGEAFTINGGAIGLLFVLANLYLFLLVEKLTDKKTALVVTLFSALNFRFYFLLWGGNWANVISILFGIPTLYYYAKYLETRRGFDFLYSSIFLLLTAASHTMHFLFVVFLMFGLWFGMKFFKNTTFKFPAIKFDLKELDRRTWSTLFRTLFFAGIAFFVTFVPFALAGTRTKWLGEWKDYLLAFDKVPGFWHYGVITDGPILVVLAVLGVLYALYKQNWKLLGLVVPSYIIVNLTSIIVPEDIWMSLFVYRFQAFHFVVLAILAVYFVLSVMKDHKKLRNVLTMLLILSLGWQAAKMSALMYMVEPAITEDEKMAAEYMGEIDEDFWLLNNINTWSSFRSYEWIMAYGDTHADNHSEVIDEEALAAEYLMIQDADALTDEDKTLLENNNKQLIFQQGPVVIYK